MHVAGHQTGALVPAPLDKAADPKAAKAADANAKDNAVAPQKDLDIRLAPGQAANVALEQPQDGKGGPQDPAKDSPEIKQLKELLTGLTDLLKKLTATLEKLLGGAAPAAAAADGKGGPAAADGKGGPAAADGKGGPAAANTAPATEPGKDSKPTGGGPAPNSNPTLKTLEDAFGKWSGKGKNKSAPTGPKATKYTNEALEKYSKGDMAGAQEAYSKAQKTGSPIMLDLNNDKKLGTTGVSTAKDRVDGQTGKTVAFDLDGNGVKEQVEWADGKGDGFLVDDSDGGATAAMNGNGEIDGRRLFGDQGGKFANGYDKLKKFDTNNDGVLRGDELKGLKVWVDNGDASLGKGELKSLAELGITEISVGMKTAQNARGENLMQSSFVQNGERRLSEDVWFAQK
jgi:hypothetical protein